MKNTSKHSIRNASPFATKQLGDKLDEVLEQAEKKRKTVRACELLIAASIGGAIALAFVVAHLALTTKWTW